MYACGDCYPGYKVQHVYNNSTHLGILNRDININFRDEKTENQYENKLGICTMCFEYYFTGRIAYSTKMLRYKHRQVLAVIERRLL
jgi:DNA gyrase/topoisomerase IV subunit B